MRVTRLSSALIAVVLVGASACGGGTSESACADVADDAVAMVEDILAEVEGRSLAEVDEERMNELQTEFDERGEELNDRAQEACESEEQFGQLVSERLEDVEVEGELAQLVLEGMRGQFGDADGGASVPPTDAGTGS